MTLDLDAIKVRLAAATNGKWCADAAGSVWSDTEPMAIVIASGVEPHNADLIANASTDIANLIAEVERLRDENAQLVEEADWWASR